MSKPNKLGCEHPKVVRRSRNGLVDAFMFKLGRYPWACRMCGCRLYYKDRGPSPEKGAGSQKGRSGPSGNQTQRSVREQGEGVRD